MNFKKILNSFLSFGKGLKDKGDNHYYNEGKKLSSCSKVVASSFSNGVNNKSILNAMFKNIPCAILSCLVLLIISLFSNAIFESVGYVGAGFICFFIFTLIELSISNFKHYKTHGYLKHSIIIVAISFILTCGTALRQVYHLLTGSYLTGTLFDFNAGTVLLIVVFLSLLTKGVFKKDIKTFAAIAISVLYVIFNITYIKTFAAVRYIRLGLVLAMAVMVILELVKNNDKSKKINFKAPLIILGGTVILSVILMLVLKFVFKDDNTLKFTLQSLITTLFSGDVSSLAVVGKTLGGTVIDNNTLYGILAPISFIMPGSFIVNLLALIGFRVGVLTSIPAGAIYMVLGLVIALGFALFAISAIMALVKSGKNLDAFITLKRWTSATVTGILFTTILYMGASFVNLLRVSFPGAVGLLFVASLTAVIYFVNKYYSINKKLLAVLSSLFTLLIMIFSSGVSLF